MKLHTGSSYAPRSKHVYSETADTPCRPPLYPNNVNTARAPPTLLQRTRYPQFVYAVLHCSLLYLFPSTFSSGRVADVVVVVTTAATATSYYTAFQTRQDGAAAKHPDRVCILPTVLFFHLVALLFFDFRTVFFSRKIHPLKVFFSSFRRNNEHSKLDVAC